MRRAIVLVACGLLAGCSDGIFGSKFNGVGTPAPATLSDFSTATVNESGSLTPGDYLIASLSYTNEKCHEFFDRLESFKQDSAYVDRLLNALSIAAVPLIDPAASAATVKAVSTGFDLATSLNNTTADIYAFAAYKEKLKRHVFQQMAAYQRRKNLDLLQYLKVGLIDPSQPVTTKIRGRDVPITTAAVGPFLNERTPSNLMIARSVAADYASLCSLSNMREIVSQALDSTTSGVDSGSSSLAAPATPVTKGTEEMKKPQGGSS